MAQVQREAIKTINLTNEDQHQEVRPGLEPSATPISPLKSNRIRQRDTSRKIPICKEAYTTTSQASWTKNKGPRATPIIKVTMKRVLEEPYERHLQVVVKEWEMPSEQDKEEIQRMIEEEIDVEPEEEVEGSSVKAGKRVHFGTATTIEIDPIGHNPGKYEDKGIFPELFTTAAGTKIHDALGKHQGIGCGSRNSLLKGTNSQHQMAKKLTSLNKTRRPQFQETLKLRRGWSSHNTLATLHAFHKLVSDMSQNTASNRIAQQQGREYQIVEAIARAERLEHVVDDLATPRVREVLKGQKPENRELEQNQHHELAKSVMKNVVVEPLAGTSILVLAGKDLASVSGLITGALNVVHQINMKSEPTKKKFVRRQIREERIRQANVGLGRDVEMHLGRAVIQTDCQESNNLSELALLITNFQRGLQDKYRISAKSIVEGHGKAIVSALLPEKEDDWQKATIQQAIRKHGGVDAFFQAVADLYELLIMIANGTSKQRLIKEEQRPYLEAN